MHQLKTTSVRYVYDIECYVKMGCRNTPKALDATRVWGMSAAFWAHFSQYGRQTQRGHDQRIARTFTNVQETVSKHISSINIFKKACHIYIQEDYISKSLLKKTRTQYKIHTNVKTKQ